MAPLIMLSTLPLSEAKVTVITEATPDVAGLDDTDTDSSLWNMGRAFRASPISMSVEAVVRGPVTET